MIKAVNAIILKTEKVEETAAFYQALELPLERNDNENGPTHFTCDLAGVHFAIFALSPYDGPERRSKARDTMVGFTVESIDKALQRLEPMNVETVLPVEDVPWGRRTVITDPDGRPVELNEPKAD